MNKACKSNDVAIDFSKHFDKKGIQSTRSLVYLGIKIYLCKVFFMVLDFKVNGKGLSGDKPFFYF